MFKTGLDFGEHGPRLVHMPFEWLGLIFFNTWFTDFFSKYKGRRREKNKKNKIIKFFFLFNLKHIWIGEKNKQKLYDFTL